MSQIKISEQIGGTIIEVKGQFVGGEETDQLRETLREISNRIKTSLLLTLKKQHT